MDKKMPQGERSSNLSGEQWQALWQLLYNNNADLVLEGHDHIYERFAPQTSTGVVDPARGIRLFNVSYG